MKKISKFLVLTLAAFALLTLCNVCCAQSEFDGAPIRYSSWPASDAVNELKKQIESGEKSVKWSKDHGWLPAVLKALNVPQSSQTLVYSKTSLQFSRIDPARPRAIYFNDDIYVGWVQGGDVIEVAAADPNLGATFYSIQQQRAKRPAIVRDRGNCLSCHLNSRTKSVPGFLVRSLFTESSGQPAYRLGSLTTDHTTPLKDRFGGWYVTGKHGDMRHRGNGFVTDDAEDSLDREKGANLTTLPDTMRSEAYLQPSSDIVALMVLEHQTQMHNLITNASFTARQALHQQETMNRILERQQGFQSESTVRRINTAVEKLLEYMFFCDEYELTNPITGSAEFQHSFQQLAKRDSKGRSLRDFDLKTRMFRYRCSFLVHSDSFLALPEPVLKRVKQRMLNILTETDQSETFAHLTTEDRKDILEILRETHPLFKE